MPDLASRERSAGGVRTSKGPPETRQKSGPSASSAHIPVRRRSREDPARCERLSVPRWCEACDVAWRRLLRAAGVALGEHRNADDAVACARGAPAAVEHDAVERLLVLAAERDAVHALRSLNGAEELALRREHV